MILKDRLGVLGEEVVGRKLGTVVVGVVGETIGHLHRRQSVQAVIDEWTQRRYLELLEIVGEQAWEQDGRGVGNLAGSADEVVVTAAQLTDGITTVRPM